MQFRGHKHMLLGFVLLILLPLAYAQEEEAKAAGMSDRFWDIVRQLPNFQLKMEYLGQNLVLPNFGWITLVSLVILAALLVIFRNHYFPQGKIAWNPVLTLAIFFAVILGLLFSVFTFYSEGGESGIVVCKTPEECTIAMHVHADIAVHLCGEDVSFPLETGLLSMAHTHKERNLIHWHDVEPVDPATEAMMDPSELTLKAFFEQMEMRFADGCIGDYCNGDACPGGAAGAIKMSVNGVPSEEYENYVWKDGDEIEIEFG